MDQDRDNVSVALKNVLGYVRNVDDATKINADAARNNTERLAALESRLASNYTYADWLADQNVDTAKLYLKAYRVREGLRHPLSQSLPPRELSKEESHVESIVS